ncbi:hypothetical protein KUTeg_009994 [Tegillarca granosa]|uniref:Ion transport domain-containing protein n=1 Tax=Tegillarca granosa TaxID=220873 RepID=A0ABQ9F5H6_TEGGR|nr:hypothetical protein KUTeg_009994 [Tegillarca granosa]
MLPGLPLFLCVYTVEAMLKILAKGPFEYFTTGWDLFDFMVTFTSVIGVLGEFFEDSFYYVTVLRPFRLLRLFKIKKRYRDVLGTLFVLFSRLISLAIVIMLVYYFFAIIGMEVFLNIDLRNCCKNTSVEDFYRFDNNSFYNGYYYLNDFENILISGVTLFELTVVNNWFIIMEGYAHHVSEWTRVYFMMFYIVMMVVMTIVVAFILESFMFRIQYRRKLKVDDIDDHSKHKVQILLSEEEKHMCENKNAILTGLYLKSQAENPNIPTPHIYDGERIRSKDDFSLRMYSDEVKGWIEDDQNEREDMIRNMEELRQRRRANAEFARIIHEDFRSKNNIYC